MPSIHRGSLIISYPLDLRTRTGAEVHSLAFVRFCLLEHTAGAFVVRDGDTEEIGRADLNPSLLVIVVPLVNPHYTIWELDSLCPDFRYVARTSAGRMADVDC